MSTNIEDFQTLDFTDPDAAEAWADETDMTPAQRRRVDAWVKAWRTELGRGHVDHLNDFSAAITKEYQALTEALEADCREAAELPALLRTGRLTSKEALQKLAQLQRNRASYLKRLDTINASVERWDSASDADPIERLHATQERFKVGAPKYGTRSLTTAILRGEAS